MVPPSPYGARALLRPISASGAPPNRGRPYSNIFDHAAAQPNFFSVRARPHGLSRLLCHVAVDETRNEPGIDLFASAAGVDAVMLGYGLFPFRVPVSDAHCAVGRVRDFDPLARLRILENVTLTQLRQWNPLYCMQNSLLARIDVVGRLRRSLSGIVLEDSPANGTGQSPFCWLANRCAITAALRHERRNGPVVAAVSSSKPSN
jgi:hypothetical protein